MVTAPPVTARGLVYQVLNRAKRRAQRFARPADYAAFLGVLGKATTNKVPDT